VAPLATDVDLAQLRAGPGEGRRLELSVAVAPFSIGAQTYVPEPALVPVVLDISRLLGGGYALRLRFQATLRGPCMRCLEEAQPSASVDVREVDQPGGGEELSSPYVHRAVLDLAAWTRDALALSLPAQLLCAPDCAGLCPVCAANLNDAGPEHHHEREPDARWAKLRELRME
jgi:uncharacterized protein